MLGVAYAAEPAISSRPVGFVRISVSSNEQKLVSLPFKPFDSSIDSIFSGQTSPDAVLSWNNSSLTYDEAYRASDGRFYSDPSQGTLSGMELLPGEGFFLWNRQDFIQEVFLAGGVVLSASNTIELGPSLNLVGYPYSTAPFSVSPSLPVAASSFKIAEGCWFNNTSSVSVVWVEVRPYADVFPEEGDKPAISDIQIRDGKEAVLTIEPAGAPGERLDIYYKDISSTDRLETAGGWLMAETDIPAQGQTQITWTDSGNITRQPVSEVFGRCYLVGRVDIDFNNDGMPDARDRFVFGRWPSGTGTVVSILNNGTSGNDNVYSNYMTLLSLTNSMASLSSPHAKVIYVDQKKGADHLTGRSAVVVGSDGPKKTVRSGVVTSTSGDAIIVNAGRYSEHLNVAGRNVKVTFNGRVDLTGRAPAVPQSVIPVVYPLTNGACSNFVGNIK